MLTPRQEAARAVYNDMMGEAKMRFDAIKALTDQAGTGAIPGLFAQECVYLQLRMLCELVAVACLVAHGDITATARLKDNWRADRIFKELQKLHQDFFPKPLEGKVIKVEADGRKHLHFTPITSGTFTREELVALYQRCGEQLHLGSLNKLLYADRKVDPAAVIDAAARLATLLRLHRIAMIDGKQFVSMLESHDGRPQTIIAEPQGAA
jgi:hypothetical protein